MFRLICINTLDRADEEAAIFNGCYTFENEAIAAYVEAIAALGHDRRYKIELQRLGAVSARTVERRRVARANG